MIEPVTQTRMFLRDLHLCNLLTCASVQGKCSLRAKGIDLVREDERLISIIVVSPIKFPTIQAAAKRPSVIHIMRAHPRATVIGLCLIEAPWKHSSWLRFDAISVEYQYN